jgi:hypothetical protein
MCELLGHAPRALAQRQTSVEYSYDAWDAYFVTSFPNEIAALDGGAFGGVWKRTGQAFTVWTGPTSGAVPTCRFFSVVFAPRSSHFYTDRSDECASTQQNPGWQYEGIAFFLQALTAANDCPPGTVILYRLYNNGMGGAPNHRFITDPALIAPMIAAGWSLEGDGPKTAFACTPLPPPLAFRKGPTGTIVTAPPATFVEGVTSLRLTGATVDDILVGTDAVDVVLEPQHDGMLVNMTAKLFPPQLNTYGDPALVDFNRDGRLDIFLGRGADDFRPYGATNGLLRSKPDGTFEDASALLPPLAGSTGCTAVGDVNGDGYSDIYVGNVGFEGKGIGPYFLLNNGGTSFTMTSSNLPPDVASLAVWYGTCALLDVDGDGYPDLVLGAGFKWPSVILLNDGHGDYTKRPQVSLPPGLFDGPARNTTTLAYAAIDLNGDGFPDLVASQTQPVHSAGHAIQALINDGHGGFTDQTSAYIANAVDAAYNWIPGLKIVDLNGDGIPDIAAGGGILHRDHSDPPVDSPVLAWVSDGRGHWLPMTASDVDPTWDSSFFISYLWIDVDGDGLPDLILFTVDDGDPTHAGQVPYQVYFNATPRPRASDRPR